MPAACKDSGGAWYFHKNKGQQLQGGVQRESWLHSIVGYWEGEIPEDAHVLYRAQGGTDGIRDSGDDLRVPRAWQKVKAERAW